MTSPAIAVAETTEETTGLDTAYRLLWLAVVFDVLAFGIGFEWDRRWHATHPFEDFFSPPHLFVYSMHLCATMTLAYITFQPELRRWFGEAFRLPPFPFPVPGPIALAGGGFVVTALAGFFDAIWHTAFGLDETAWSFPHSMLGWGIFIAFLGITSCRLAIARWKPLGIGSSIVFGFLIVATSLERFAGPYWNNISPDVLRFIAAIPVLAAEPPFQHTIRIYLAENITRWNPLFAPLAAAGVGLGFGLLRRLDARPLLLLGFAMFLTYSSNYVPLIVPALVLASNANERVGWRGWMIAGLAFGVAVWIVWHGDAVAAILAAPFMLGGARLADGIWDLLERPAKRAVLTLVVLAGIGAPIVTGVIDLSLRSRIP